MGGGVVVGGGFHRRLGIDIAFTLLNKCEKGK